MEWGPIISGLLAIAGALLKLWLDNAPARAAEATSESTQKGRVDIASGNAAAVSERIDSLLAAPTPGAGSAPGQHDTGDLLKQFAGEEGVEILPDRT